MTEVTGRQDTGLLPIYIRAETEELPVSLATTYSAKRILRRDPTVALGRAFSVAPILTSVWSIQAEEDIPKEVTRFIRRNVLPWRLRYLVHGLFSMIDYGWAPYEVVYGYSVGTRKVELVKLKPLLQDITSILIRTDTGAFDGFIQDNEIIVGLPNALLLSGGVEGTMWYGNSLLDNVTGTQTTWTDANDGARRYDLKIAGSHFVVYYPPGNCLDEAGAEVPNSERASQILEALESSGSIAVPTTILEHVEELNREQQAPYEWKIEILEDKGGRQVSFTARLKYLDTLKIRGLLMPERSMMEGSHGTLAEASAHIDLALTHMDFVHLYVTEVLSLSVVDTLLAANWGSEFAGKVWIVPASLVDARRVYLERVFLEMLSGDKGVAVADYIDGDTLKDLIGVPKSDVVTEDKKTEGDKNGRVEKESENGSGDS